jgi:signal peptidase I
LTFLHPALGYLYVGRGRAAIVATVVFTLYLVAFVSAWTALKFFPVLPFLVFLVGWLVLSALCLVDTWRSSRSEGLYVLRPYNHPVVYALFALMFGALPAYLGYHVSLEVVWGVVAVNDQAMSPTVLPGDVLLVDRTAFWRTIPERGDMVVLSASDGGGMPSRVIVGRVIAVAGDLVKVEDSLLEINEEKLHHDRFDPGDGQLEDNTFIERNGGKAYLIAGEATAPPASTQAPITVTDRNILILGDNRQLASTGPSFATVANERVIGRPRYLLYSGDPDSSEVRWDRIGLRVR